MDTDKKLSKTIIRWAFAENMAWALAFAAIVVWAPGWWKFAALVCVLSLNYVNGRKNNG